MPVLNKPDKFGDLYIELTVVLPTSLTKDQITNLQKVLPYKPVESKSEYVQCNLQKVSHFERYIFFRKKERKNNE